ncbi:hypothetical protein [Hamadaea tsunoensis]|uniref:hypothetical protein n=1 Tax=Hamadaea tsunoensis TaxID=53368 RepID=UPI00040F2254|nr:hypothetical protein [Hamadaea tsunoensis]
MPTIDLSKLPEPELLGRDTDMNRAAALFAAWHPVDYDLRITVKPAGQTAVDTNRQSADVNAGR